MAAAPIRQPAMTSDLAAEPAGAAGRRTCPTANMVIADGSSISPDRVMLAPNP